jgi:hypothetical protein
MRRGNIIVDFFTAKAASAPTQALDRLGALLFALAMALMTWRTARRRLNAWQSSRAR